MAWSTPRTWNSGETVTAALMNAHLRDQLNVLKTKIDDNGLLRTLYAGPAVAGNVTTGEDTLTSFTATGGNLSALGHGFDVMLNGSLANNTNAKTIRFKVGSISLTLLSAYAAAVAGNRFMIRLQVTWDGNTACRVSGWMSYGAAQGATPILLQWGGNQMAGLSGWSADQTVSFTGEATATNDILPTECVVNAIR